MIDEGEEPGRTDMGNGIKRARQADYGGDSCGAGSCLRYGTVFCGGKNHCAAACGGEGVFGLSAVASDGAWRFSSAHGAV